MPRQPEAGKAFLLSSDTLGKVLNSLKKKAPQRSFPNTDTNIISIVNKTGSRVASFHALEIDESSYPSTQNEYFSDNTFRGITPSVNSTRLAVLLEPAEDNSISQAAISGICPAYVDVSNLDHTHAFIGSSGLLGSGTRGPLMMLETPTATGLQVLKCLFSPAVPASAGMIHGVLQSDITNTSTQVDVSVTFSLLEDVSVGDIVTATNVIGYSGSTGGDAIVWYHGDGTGNEDGTYTLMGARCPA